MTNVGPTRGHRARPIVARIGCVRGPELAHRVGTGERVVVVHFFGLQTVRTGVVIRLPELVREVVNDRGIARGACAGEQARQVVGDQAPESVVPRPGPNTIARVDRRTVWPLRDAQEGAPLLLA